MAKRKDERFQWSREASRVQVLGAENVRIFDHQGLAWTLNGKQVNVAADLQRLLAMIGDEDAECRDRIYDQLPEEWRERADRNIATDDDGLLQLHLILLRWVATMTPAPSPTAFLPASRDGSRGA